MANIISKHFFKYGSRKYFRGNAHLLEIGHAGEKKDPIGANAYLDPYGKIKAKHMTDKVHFNTVASIDWTDVKKADLEAGVSMKFMGLGRKGGLSFDYAKAKSAKLKLMSFSIDEGPLKRILNNDANIIRNYLADEGKDARVVGEVWVVAEAKLAEHFDSAAKADYSVEAFGNSLEITAEVGHYGSQTIEISAGTTFAYKLYKVKKWNKGKTKIEDLEADYKGMG